MVTQNCNPRSREVALGGSLELVNHPVQPISRLQVQWETLSRIKSRSNCGRSLTSASCFYRPTRVSTPEHTYRLSYNTHTQDNKLFRFNITVTSLNLFCVLFTLAIMSANQVALVLSYRNSTKYSACDSVNIAPNKTTR